MAVLGQSSGAGSEGFHFDAHFLRDIDEEIAERNLVHSRSLDLFEFTVLVAAAREAAERSYSPYSGYAVGAALRFADGSVVTGTNIENASYGLALCAETVAVGRAMAEGRRGGLEAVAVIGPGDKGGGVPITPCGRCRPGTTSSSGPPRRWSRPGSRRCTRSRSPWVARTRT